MIKIEKTEIVGLEHAIRGMRNPMNSWEKSDSTFFPPIDCTTSDDVIEGCGVFRCYTQPCTVLGPNDLDLMKRLVKAGTDHRKFMRMIVVYVDIIAPLYWWKEYDTYKVGTVSNSCSTMHKIHEKEFTLEDFSHEHLLNLGNWESMDALFLDKTNIRVDGSDLLCLTINVLNYYRNRFLKTKDKNYWWQMIQLLPSSYNQKRTIMLNYEVLVGMYRDRKNHKLDEWRELCEWIETLPYSELITGLKEEKKPMTNVERIKNMSVEEMAKLFCTEGMFLWDRDASDIDDFKNWLRAEVEE